MRDKQIEDMAKEVIGGCDECSKCLLSFDCKAYEYATKFYNAGYRKASEVIEDVFLALDKRTEDEGLVFIKKSDIVKAIKKTKVEIAREIIENIEVLLSVYTDNSELSETLKTLIELIKRYLCAEIKKKYESEGEG